MDPSRRLTRRRARWFPSASSELGLPRAMRRASGAREPELPPAPRMADARIESRLNAWDEGRGPDRSLGAVVPRDAPIHDARVPTALATGARDARQLRRGRRG